MRNRSLLKTLNIESSTAAYFDLHCKLQGRRLRHRNMEAAGAVRLILVSAFLLLFAVFVSGQEKTQGNRVSLSKGFYESSCPRAERITRDAVYRFNRGDRSVAPALLRLLFHDCFVQGCDASVLIRTTDPNAPAEMDASPNINSLRGFDIIDAIKEELENECPGVVSCADIIALAARESVFLTGGPRFPMLMGRRDGMSSNASLAEEDLPSPFSDTEQTIGLFTSKGLNQTDYVTLLGAHSIGRARCQFIRDKSLNGGVCAHNVTGNFPDNVTIELDPHSSNRFDNHFYASILRGQGVLQTDHQLANGSYVEAYHIVRAFTRDNKLFMAQFVASLLKMSQLQVLTGVEGEIRRNCSSINSLQPPRT